MIYQKSAFILEEIQRGSMFRSIPLITAILLFVLAPDSLFPFDRIRLSRGDILSGRLLFLDSQWLILEAQHGNYRIPAHLLQSLEPDASLRRIILRDGTEYAGKLLSYTGKICQFERDEERLDFDSDEIVSITVIVK